MVDCSEVKGNAPALFWNDNLDLIWEESKTWLKKEILKDHEVILPLVY